MSPNCRQTYEFQFTTIHIECSLSNYNYPKWYFIGAVTNKTFAHNKYSERFPKKRNNWLDTVY